MRYFHLKTSLAVLLLIAINFPVITMADGLSSFARLETAKSRMLENSAQESVLNNNHLNIHQAYGRTIIMGVMMNTQNIHADGNVATAAGTQLNVGDVAAKKGTNITGNRVDVDGAPGSVYVRVKTINRGNISANASGFDAEANAAGSQINVNGARGIVSIQAHTTSQGNINANASGFSDVEANASAVQLNIQGHPSAIRVNGTILSTGDITARARGGIAAALKDE